MASEPLKPSPALLAKIGSIVGHAEEYHAGSDPHPFDLQAMMPLLSDPEVQEWLQQMRKLAFIPVPRHQR